MSGGARPHLVGAGTACCGMFYGRRSTGTLASSTARSHWNRSGMTVRVYASASGTGLSTCLAAGAKKAVTVVANGTVVMLTAATC